MILLDEACKGIDGEKLKIVESRKQEVLKRISQRRQLYVLAKTNYFLGSVEYFPYFAVKKLDEFCGYQISAFRTTEKAIQDNVYNERRGFRTKEESQKFLRRARRVETFTGAEKLRIFDSMATIYATKLGVDPAGVVVDVDLLNRNKGIIRFSPMKPMVRVGKRTVRILGEFEVSKEVFDLDGEEFMDKLVEGFAQLDTCDELAWMVKQFKEQATTENLT